MHETGHFLPKLRLPRLRTPRPRTAIDAYRFSVAALDGTADARLADETPREHASRVGIESGAELRRLAADYQLAAFGEVGLSAAEERRAIARWQRIVREVRRAPRPRPVDQS